MIGLRCLVVGHTWSGWGDNGCYTVHEDPTEEAATDVEHWHYFTRFCGRCHVLEGTERLRIGFEPDASGTWSGSRGQRLRPVFAK